MHSLGMSILSQKILLLTPRRAKVVYSRGSYGVLRAGWSATGLGRLLVEPISVGSPAPIYQHYHRRLTRLLTLVYRHSDSIGIPTPRDL